MVSMVAFQAVDPGSIPGRRIFIFFKTCSLLNYWLQDLIFAASVLFRLSSMQSMENFPLNRDELYYVNHISNSFEISSPFENIY